MKYLKILAEDCNYEEIIPTILVLDSKCHVYTVGAYVVYDLIRFCCVPTKDSDCENNGLL